MPLCTGLLLLSFFEYFVISIVYSQVVKTNYILIDFENVQPGQFYAPNDFPIRVLIFVGENQTKISLDLAESLQKMGSKAEYIRISGSGQNALDFHLAYWVGRLAEREPDAYFHIISKDKGFDPLIKHLKSNKILAQRVAQVADIHVLNGCAKKSTSERVDHVVAFLRSRGNSVPRKRETLSNTIKAIFANLITAEDIAKVVQSMETKKIVTIKDNKVTYHFPDEGQKVSVVRVG